MDEQPSPLQEIRDRLALAIGENAVFDGWTQASVDAAADQARVDRDQARLAVPKDQAGKIDIYIRAVDRELQLRSLGDPPDSVETIYLGGGKFFEATDPVAKRPGSGIVCGKGSDSSRSARYGDAS